MTRIAITGMGGHLGTGVALALDSRPGVELLGIDLEPPRRLLRSARFHRVQPENTERATSLLVDFEPDVIVHLGVYEPHARSNPKAAHRRTLAVTRSVLEAAGQMRGLASVVVRSGLEVYGRSRTAPLSPDEDSALRPTTNFGRTLAMVEQRCEAFEQESGVPVARLRFAPIVGPHIPSPIGRYLRLPAVPVATLFDAPFSLLHVDDVPAFVLAAADQRVSGAFNAVGPGAVTGWQAVRMGGKLPVPVAGPAWYVARAITGLLGSPLPEHGLELLTRGRTGSPHRAETELGVVASYSTPEVIKDLHDWAPVSYLSPGKVA